MQEGLGVGGQGGKLGWTSIPSKGRGYTPMHLLLPKLGEVERMIFTLVMYFTFTPWGRSREGARGV